MMLEAGKGAVIGLMLEGALLATWQAGGLVLEAAAAAVGVVEGCQKAVPGAKEVVSFRVYGLAVTKEFLGLEVVAWSRLRDGTGLVLTIPLRTGV